MEIDSVTEGLSEAVFQFECGSLRGLRGGFPGFVNGRGQLGNFRALIHFHNAGIGNFPSESLYAPLLLVAFFKEYGLARVGGQISCGRKDNISRSVSYDNAPSQHR